MNMHIFYEYIWKSVYIVRWEKPVDQLSKFIETFIC